MSTYIEFGSNWKPFISQHSATDEWNEHVQEYTKSHKNRILQTEFLCNLPYRILGELAEGVSKNWDVWSLPIHHDLKLEKPTTAYEFFKKPVAHARIIDIIHIAKDIDKTPFSKRISQFSYVTSPVYHSPNLSKNRKDANLDFSRGFVGDLSEETILILSKQIIKASEEKRSDWKFLADGLGFDRLSCLKFKSPAQVLKEWVSRNHCATVSRLYFELKVLNMDFVCCSVDSIPYEGKQKNKPQVDFSDDFPLTIFYIRELFLRAKILKLRNIEFQVFKILDCYSLLKSDSSKSCNHNFFSVTLKEFAQTFSSFKTGDFNELEKLQAYFNESSHQVVEWRSPGGISLSEIYYLSKEIFKGKDCRVFAEHVFPGIVFEDRLTFTQFLMFYWQDANLGESLSLRQLYNKIIDFLNEREKEFLYAQTFFSGPCNDFTNALVQFKKSYSEIKYERSAPGNVQEIDILARTTLGECVVCMEKKINAIPYPCGHLQFCLDCLQAVNTCPTCRTSIQNITKIYV